MMLGYKWPRSRYALPACEAAPALLGRYLVHETKQGTIIGRIVETEAYGGTYRGQPDDGSHAFRGLTKRTEPMFRAGGWSYVYLIYGMYCCMNIVTGLAGEGQAVLIRAVEPVAGIDTMLANRDAAKVSKNLTNGPGKLCRAMAIDLAQNKLDLYGSELYIWEPEQLERYAVGRSPRIHIDYAVWGKKFPWRFYIKGNSFVSQP